MVGVEPTAENQQPVRLILSPAGCLVRFSNQTFNPMLGVCMNPSVRYAQRDITQLAHMRGPLSDARVSQLLKQRRPDFPQAQMSRRELSALKAKLRTSTSRQSHESVDDILKRYNIID